MPIIKIAIELSVLFVLVCLYGRSGLSLLKKSAIALFVIGGCFFFALLHLYAKDMADWVSYTRLFFWLVFGISLFFSVVYAPQKYRKPLLFGIVTFIVVDLTLEILPASVLFEEVDNNCEEQMRGSYVQDFWHSYAGSAPGC